MNFIRLFAALAFLSFTYNLSLAQILVEFPLKDSIVAGPFVESPGNFTIYNIWYDDPDSRNNALLRVKVDKEGKVVTHERHVTTLEKNDEKFIVAKFPKSKIGDRDFKERVLKKNALRGSGITNKKSPFGVRREVMIFNKDSSDFTSFPINYLSVKSENKNGSWIKDEIFTAENPENFPSVVTFTVGHKIKKDKTKKNSQEIEKQVIAFNDQGKIVSKSKFNFESPMKHDKEGIFIDNDYNLAGKYFLFKAKTSKGISKLYPKQSKEDRALIITDKEGKIIDQITFKDENVNEFSGETKGFELLVQQGDKYLVNYLASTKKGGLVFKFYNLNDDGLNEISAIENNLVSIAQEVSFPKVDSRAGALYGEKLSNSYACSNGDGLVLSCSNFAYEFYIMNSNGKVRFRGKQHFNEQRSSVIFDDVKFEELDADRVLTTFTIMDTGVIHEYFVVFSLKDGQVKNLGPSDTLSHVDAQRYGNQIFFAGLKDTDEGRKLIIEKLSLDDL